MSPAYSAYPKRGEVYLAQLDKLRPVIIISTDALNQFALDVCVVPTTGMEHAEFSVRIPIRAKEGGLDIKRWAKCDQVTTLEKADLRSCIGVLPSAKFVEIEKQVKICLGLQ